MGSCLKLSSSSNKLNRARTVNRDRKGVLWDQIVALKALRDQAMAHKALRTLGASCRRTAHRGIKSRTTIKREGTR